MPEQHLQVDFDCDDRSVHISVWVAFWASTRSWLAEHGYTLFEYGYDWGDRHIGEATCLIPKLNNMSVSDVVHPFSKYGGDVEGIPVPALSGYVVVCSFLSPPLSTLIRFKERITFAQDSLQRHVALRLAKKSSHEYKIQQFLRKESRLFSLEEFDGVLPPLDLLDIGDHCIVVMPRYSTPNASQFLVCLCALHHRWGEVADIPWFSTIGEILDYMRYWLKVMFWVKSSILFFWS